MSIIGEGGHDRLFVASVEKAFQVLEAFDIDRRDLGIGDIMQKTGLDKSAAQRYAHTLHRLNYLQKDEVSRRYMLSQKVLGMANNFLRVDPLVAKATPYIVNLRLQFDARFGLGCLHHNKAMYLLPLQSNNAAFQTAHPGHIVPLYCTTTGRVLLSFKSDQEVRAILEASERPKRTQSTKTNVDEIMQEVQKVRDQGFCITDQELRMGDRNLGVPLLKQDGTAVGVLAVVCNRQEWTQDRILQQVAPTMMEAARSIMAD